MPRAGNDSGGGQPGWILKCKGWETDPNAYIYFITQAPVWAAICDVIGEPEWKTDPAYATPQGAAAAPQARSSRRIEQWTDDQDQVRGDGHPEQARHSLRADPVDEGDRCEDRRCAPPARWSRSIIRRAASTCTVGNPIKMSDSPTEVTRSPLLGEHTDEECYAKCSAFPTRSSPMPAPPARSIRSARPPPNRQ
ncbi:MAG: CoA transferase [Rhodopseudomonas palustris]|nr:CoA transferase [Rhodopseudomonas palustris]